MGNILIKCRSPRKQNARNGDDGEDIHDGALINNNNDNYFTKENFDEIIKKFPEFKDWSDQNTWSVARSRTKQRKIKWKEGEAIGNGSFGRVIMGLNLQKGDMMAVKQVQIGASNTPAQQERIKALEVEIDLLSHLSHKNIVRYFGSHRTKTTFNIFLEYVSGGTIASLIEKYGPLNENLVRVYTKQILEGLEYLHVQNTVHRDIKGANVLVNNAGVCKLADFGTAKRISSIADNEAKFMPSIRGTVNWMAPEVIKQSSLGRSSDIWSVGCTVLEMLTGKVPWYHLMKAGSTQISAMYQIATAKTHPPLPEGLSPEAVDFLKQCFKINPAERSNVIKLLKHKFIVGHEPGKIQTPSQKSKKTIFGSLKCTEMTEKSEVHKKEKEKEKEHEKANSKQRPSFLKYIPTSHKSEDEVETISSSTLADKIAKEKKESKEAISNGGIGSKKIEEEKQIDVTKKPKFVIKSDPQTNSINLDQLNRDDRSVRTVSSPPIEEIVHYKKNSMDESNHYYKEDDKIHKPQKSAFQRERGTSPDQSPTYKEENDHSKPVLSQKSPKIRPLGRTRRSSVLDDHNVSGNGSIVISRKTSDAVNPTEPNSQRSRRQSLFNAKEGNNKSDKDVLADKNNIIKEFADEEARSSARMKRLSLKHNEDGDKHSEKETQSPGGTLKESKLSDSDCELSQQYQHQSRVSNSIQTVYVPENHRTGESSVYQKRIHALKNSLSKKAKVDFGGIKMTESVVVPKKHESKGSMDAFNKDQVGTEQYYMNTGLYMNKKTLISPRQKRSQNIESLMLGESINPPDKFGKHVTNNLMDTRREGEMMTSIAITLQRPDTGVLDPSYVIGKEGLEHDGLHMPYLQQEHVK